MKIKLHVTILWIILNTLMSLVSVYVLGFKGQSLIGMILLGNVPLCLLLYACIVVENDANLTIFKIDK